MKYQCRVDIDRPLREVVELFDNPDNLRYWQPGLISYDHIHGSPGQQGAQATMHYKMGKREVVMTETILERNLPQLIRSSYETEGVLNIQETRFEPIDDKRTRYISDNEFRFSGFMKLMGWLMPGAFKKQTRKYMEQFKDFAETQNKK